MATLWADVEGNFARFTDSPTAHTSFGAIAVTPNRRSNPRFGVGAWIWVKSPPEENSASVHSKFGRVASPTAQMSFGPAAETARNSIGFGFPSVWTGMRIHPLP